MRKISNSYKSIFILSSLLILTAAVFLFLYNAYIIFVKGVEHGVLVSKTDLGGNFKYDFLIDGKLQSFTTRDKTIELEKDVVNFKYRNGVIVEISGYPEPVKEKIMARGSSSIELEFAGIINLSDKPSVYKASPAGMTNGAMSSIIVGAQNVRVYKNNNGSIKTIITESETVPSFIRVGIKNEGFQSFDHDEFEFESKGTIIIEDKKAGKAVTVPPGSKTTLIPAKDGISFKSGAQSYIFKNRVYISVKEDNSVIDVLSYERGYGMPSYRGHFEIVQSGSKLALINEVELENYLYQVVPSEMPASFGLEALKAQAVAARTYALSDLYSGRYAAEGFHVDDSTMSQVYNNSNENPVTTRAINETKGLVMKYNDELVDAKYCSTSHGYGAKSGEIWSSDGMFPGIDKPYLTVGNYLVNQEKFDLSSEKDAEAFFKNWNLKSYDSDSPYFRWKVTFTGQELKNTIEKNLPIVYESQKNYILTLTDGDFKSKAIPQNCLGELTGIEVTKRGEGGNIMELVVSGTNGTYKILKELDVRYVLRPRKSDTGSDNDMVIKRIKGKDLINNSLIPSAFMVFDITKDKTDKFDTITLYGGGYGHSVGMSQYGAGYLSSHGYTYDKILDVYYKGINIEEIY